MWPVIVLFYGGYWQPWTAKCAVTVKNNKAACVAAGARVGGVAGSSKANNMIVCKKGKGGERE